MSQIVLPPETLTLLNEAFDLLDFSEEERLEVQQGFEEALGIEFVALLVKKLPEKEAQEVMNLAKSEDEDMSQLQSKLLMWFSKEEINGAFQKAAKNLYAKLLQKWYQAGSEEQRRKLEEVFKPEALKVGA